MSSSDAAFTLLLEAIQILLLFMTISTFPTCFGWLKRKEPPSAPMHTEGSQEEKTLKPDHAKPPIVNLSGSSESEDSSKRGEDDRKREKGGGEEEEHELTRRIRKRSEEEQRMDRMTQEDRDRLEEETRKEEERIKELEKLRVVQDEEDMIATSSVESLHVDVEEVLKVDKKGFYMNRDIDDPTLRKIGKRTGRWKHRDRRQAAKEEGFEDEISVKWRREGRKGKRKVNVKRSAVEIWNE